MAHFLYNFFKGNFSFFKIFQHHHERMLHQRRTGRAFGVHIFLFFQSVRRMVGRNNVDPVVQQRFPKRFPVFLAFYCGIPFDKRTFGFVIFIGEMQVMDADFSRDFFVF